MRQLDCAGGVGGVGGDAVDDVASVDDDGVDDGDAGVSVLAAAELLPLALPPAVATISEGGARASKFWHCLRVGKSIIWSSNTKAPAPMPPCPRAASTIA